MGKKMKFLPESRFEKKKYFPVCVKKNIVLFVFKKIIALFVISYCPVCVLLNLNLAPTCKTDYLVFCCCFHRQIRNDEFNRNTINLHIFCYFFLFIYYHRSPDFDKWWCKRWYIPVCQFGPCSNKKSCFIWTRSSLGFAALTSSLGSRSNKISYLVRTRSN